MAQIVFDASLIPPDPEPLPAAASAGGDGDPLFDMAVSVGLFGSASASSPLPVPQIIYQLSARSELSGAEGEVKAGAGSKNGGEPGGGASRAIAADRSLMETLPLFCWPDVEGWVREESSESTGGGGGGTTFRPSKYSLDK